jgi:hypothetical protein
LDSNLHSPQRRLVLRDEIARLEHELTPDEPA